MYTVVVTIHIIVCVILVLTVLLQQGKGAEVGAVFGSSEAMFGSAGPASALNKVTTVVAIIFMLTSLALTYLAAHRTGDSVMEDIKVEAPAVPPVQEESGPEIPQAPVQQQDEVKSNAAAQSAAMPAEDNGPAASASQVTPSTSPSTSNDASAPKAADTGKPAAAKETPAVPAQETH